MSDRDQISDVKRCKNKLTTMLLLSQLFCFHNNRLLSLNESFKMHKQTSDKHKSYKKMTKSTSGLNFQVCLSQIVSKI